jgi:hypothetical protein
VKLPAGTYRILTGTFNDRSGSVTVYRLQPAKGKQLQGK